MRFLANENFPDDAVKALRAAGHDLVWVRTDAPGSLDPDVLARAVRENRVLLTFDKDFGRVAMVPFSAVAGGLRSAGGRRLPKRGARVQYLP